MAWWCRCCKCWEDIALSGGAEELTCGRMGRRNRIAPTLLVPHTRDASVVVAQLDEIFHHPGDKEISHSNVLLL